MKLILLVSLLGAAGGACILLWDKRKRLKGLFTRRVPAAPSGTLSAPPRDGIHYGQCPLSPLEQTVCLTAGCGAGYTVGYLFYHHPVPALLLSLAGLMTPAWRRKVRVRKRKDELARQFKQALYALVSSLTAGRSVENSFAAAVQDLRLVYTDPNTYILIEFERIDRKIANGETVEAALEDFCRRSELEELVQFTEVFTTCKRTGGNLAEVMRRTAHILGEKMEVRQELQVMFAQKRFESKILGAAPLAVIFLLYWSSPDYMAPLYGNPAGAVIMTIALLIFAACWWMTGKWMEVKL